MPYRRRTYRRRRPRRGASRAASKGYVKKVVNRAVRKDLHYFDSKLTDTSVAGSATPYRYNTMLQIPQGDTQTNRSGKMIQLTSIHIQGNAYHHVSSTTHDRIRFIIAIIKRSSNSGTQYQMPDIISTDGTVQTDVQAFRRLSTGLAPNFRILRDMTIDLGVQGSTDKATRVIKYYKKFRKPLRVWYESSTTGSPTINDIGIFAISDTSTNNPLLGLNTRVTFIP